MGSSEKVKLVEQVKVLNSLGLHTRPATIIAQMLLKSKCDVTFTSGDETIDAKNVLGILLLAANNASEIEIVVEGEEAEAHRTRRKLVHAFETRFGE